MVEVEVEDEGEDSEDDYVPEREGSQASGFITIDGLLSSGGSVGFNTFDFALPYEDFYDIRDRLKKHVEQLKRQS